MTKNVIVLGAGIVGVSAALHLRQRGCDVVLVDKRAPGEETSFGNAGLIEASSVVPYAFPRDWRTVLRFACNGSTALRYDLRSLPAYAPWLARYWRESAPAQLAAAARDMLPLVSRCVAEHEALIDRAGLHALVRPTGWLEACRSQASFERTARGAQRLAATHGLAVDILDSAALQRAEASLAPGYAGAVHWHDPLSVSDPGALTKGYAALLEREGGRIVRGDAATLEALETRGNGWRVQTEDGAIEAATVVVALGVWSGDVLRPLGYRVPLMAKRGYHMHYEGAANAALNRPVVDIENGFVVAPMKRGLRLTTGVELASRDAAELRPTGPRRTPRPAGVRSRVQTRRETVARFAPVHARHAAGHRCRGTARGLMVRLRTRASRPDARTRDGASDRGTDRRRDAGRRSGAVPASEIRLNAALSRLAKSARRSADRPPSSRRPAPSRVRRSRPCACVRY